MLRCYEIPLDCWRRVKKLQSLVSDVLTKCESVEKALSKHDEKAEAHIPLKTVYVYTIQDDQEFLKIFGEKAEEISPTCLSEEWHIETNDEENDFTLGAEFAGFFFENFSFRTIKSVSNKTIIPYSPRAIVASYNESSVLEMVVFRPLKRKSVYLQGLLKELKQKSATQDGEQKRKIKESQTAVDYLIGEIIALFNMSNIEEKFHPRIPGYELMEIDDEVSKGLFAVEKGIKGFGYRFSTLHIDIEENKRPDEIKQETRETAIKDYLQKFGITNVEFNYVSPSETKFTYVGASCTVNQKVGVLGSFAYKTNNQGYSILCGLISKHLATASQNDDSIYLENGEKLGSVLSNTTKHGGYDIAAVSIAGDIEPLCFKEFRNSDGMLDPGSLHKAVTLDDYRRLQDIPVYAWGRKCDKQPGRGKITIPRYICAACPLPHIIVMDQDASRRMAEPGDSGVIVCVDDLDKDEVLLISMLSGSPEDDKLFDENPCRLRTYTTFSLKKGVDQLSENTSCTFKLA
ncbi:uncharacterized protein LOC128549502 [Mercenaria mercenaria]|uniref:uncharacterized protein LOC128549502 n=1 Tax=Mercenaria mercenaria TaxID=6596 RepID=UPI00234EFDA3|nr:uncharacterized protein LOC128549502 [Mercenaria mercenaria]